MPLSGLIMENLICHSPQNSKLCITGWDCCIFLVFHLHLLDQFGSEFQGKERRYAKQQPGNICPFRTIPLCQGPVLSHM